MHFQQPIEVAVDRANEAQFGQRQHRAIPARERRRVGPIEFVFVADQVERAGRDDVGIGIDQPGQPCPIGQELAAIDVEHHQRRILRRRQARGEGADLGQGRGQARVVREEARHYAAQGGR